MKIITYTYFVKPNESNTQNENIEYCGKIEKKKTNERYALNENLLLQTNESSFALVRNVVFF